MKKILVNAYLALNFGDDLFLKILFDRYENVKWVIDTKNKKYLDVFKEYKNVSIKENFIIKVLRKLKLKSILKKYDNQYDCGITIGGSLFMEAYAWEKDYDRLNKLVDSFVSRNKKYYILGCNFGPYKSNEYLSSYKTLFKKTSDICFREKYSYDIFKGIDSVRLASDIVFTLKKKNVKKKENSIGISLIDISDREELKKYEYDYVNKVREIIKAAIDSGKNITFFSFCEEQGDMKVIKNVARDLDETYTSKINIVNYEGDIDKFLIEYESMENIVGTRFHACILSQVFEQGLYPIIYSNKTLNILKDIKLDNEYCTIKDIKDLDVNKLLDVIYKNKITTKSIFIEAEKQFEELDKHVK